jgi:hypothetical protein
VTGTPKQNASAGGFGRPVSPVLSTSISCVVPSGAITSITTSAPVGFWLSDVLPGSWSTLTKSDEPAAATTE